MGHHLLQTELNCESTRRTVPGSLQALKPPNGASSGATAAAHRGRGLTACLSKPEATAQGREDHFPRSFREDSGAKLTPKGAAARLIARNVRVRTLSHSSRWTAPKSASGNSASMPHLLLGGASCPVPDARTGLGGQHGTGRVPRGPLPFLWQSPVLGGAGNFQSCCAS